VVKTCGQAVHVQDVVFERSFLFVAIVVLPCLNVLRYLSVKCLYVAFLSNAVDQQYITC